MTNYVKRMVGGTEILIPARFNENFVIDFDDFEYLFNMYKFTPIKPELCFYDKKHQKTVAYIDKNLFTYKKDIHFNKNWLAHECIITKDKKLLEILHKYPENLAICRHVDDILAKIAERDAKYIAKGYYNKRISEYFMDQDEEYEPVNDNIEV